MEKGTLEAIGNSKLDTCLYFNLEKDGEFRCTCNNEKLKSESFDTGLSTQKRPIAWKYCAFLARGTATRNCYIKKD